MKKYLFLSILGQAKTSRQLGARVYCVGVLDFVQAQVRMLLFQITRLYHVAGFYIVHVKYYILGCTVPSLHQKADTPMCLQAQVECVCHFYCRKDLQAISLLTCSCL